MALDKAQKAILRAKWGDEFYDAIVRAENVIVTEDGVDKSLADVLVSIAGSALSQTDVDNRIKALVGEVPTGSEAATILAYLSGEITGVSDKVTALIGSDANKSVRTIAAEEVAKVVDDAPENFDTLKEIAAYIASDKANAAGINNAIAALQGIVAGIGGEDDESKTVVDYVTAAIEELKIGDYAKAADLTALASRVTAAEGKITELEGKVHEHANKTVLDGITNVKVTGWDSKATVYFSSTEPADAKNGDLWMQPLE